MKTFATLSVVVSTLLSSCSSGDGIEEPQNSAGGKSGKNATASGKSESGSVSFGEWTPTAGNSGDAMVSAFLSKMGTKFKKTSGLPTPSVGGPMETFVSENVRSDGVYVERRGDGTSAVGFREAWFAYGKEGRVLSYGKNWVKPAVDALSASGMTDSEREAVFEKFSSAYAKTSWFRTGDSPWMGSPVWKTVAEALSEEARR